ncbi:MAG: hypothetical protein GY820_15225 [Gammaproteobacteria bacterium]|nr:hypothetical protein [Gammaproteobacteria bacterium]
MTDKKAKIAELIELQKKFIAYEHENGVDMKDYFAPEAGHLLDGYKESFVQKAMELVDMAHAEKGSSR